MNVSQEPILTYRHDESLRNLQKPGEIPRGVYAAGVLGYAHDTSGEEILHSLWIRG